MRGLHENSGAGGAGKVTLLGRDVGSLATAVLPGEPGTLHVLGDSGGISVAPDGPFEVTFGRNEPDVYVRVGHDDTDVSRQQGIIRWEHGGWYLTNLGESPIRIPGGALVLTGAGCALNPGYSPLFIVTPHREHLLQVRIATERSGHAPHSDPDTRDRRRWPLSEREKLILVCLGQRYLRGEDAAQPLTWEQVAQELHDVRPEQKWSWRQAAHTVTEVRKRLSKSVPGLLEQDVAPPVGNTLNHNLIVELLTSATIGRHDLRLLDTSYHDEPVRARAHAPSPSIADEITKSVEPVPYSASGDTIASTAQNPPRRWGILLRSFRDGASRAFDLTASRFVQQRPYSVEEIRVRAENIRLRAGTHPRATVAPEKRLGSE